MLIADTCSNCRLRTSTLPHGRLCLRGSQAVGLLTLRWQRSHPFPLDALRKNLGFGSLHLAPGAAQVKKGLPFVWILFRAAFFPCYDCGYVACTTKGLVAHATRSHGHVAPLRFYTDGPQCPACAAFHHKRPRCLHHVRIVARCRAAVLFAAPRLLPNRVLELDLIDRKATQQLKRAGLPRLFAALPADGSTVPDGVQLLQPPLSWVPEPCTRPEHRAPAANRAASALHPHGLQSSGAFVRVPRPRDGLAFYSPGIVLHVFSGVLQQDSLLALLNHSFAAGCIDMSVVGLDLLWESSPTDLAKADVLAHWIAVVQQGLLAGMVCCPPRATWLSPSSAAQEPCPLRTSEHLWGRL